METGSEKKNVLAKITGESVLNTKGLVVGKQKT